MQILVFPNNKIKKCISSGIQHKAQIYKNSPQRMSGWTVQTTSTDKPALQMAQLAQL